MAAISPRRATSAFVLSWASVIVVNISCRDIVQTFVIVPLSHPRFPSDTPPAPHPTGKFVQLLPIMEARVNRMCTGLEHRQVAIYHLLHHRSEAHQTYLRSSALGGLSGHFSSDTV
ncbi:hypothetical protein B0H16DRAFT_1627423 [Mycena metata]|uniref:Secreted protein n=1 Tax=Mycena metata TaxID=1033252 RepID=A0AAD7H4I7_9AGAR|nr:hypothetical protein B0H16DRAFT_1627423 [Mycena metata]